MHARTRSDLCEFANRGARDLERVLGTRFEVNTRAREADLVGFALCANELEEFLQRHRQKGKKMTTRGVV